MSEADEKTLKFAKDLVTYLGCQNLPRELIDDRKKRIDPNSRTDDELILAHFNEDSLHSIKTVRFLKDFARYRAVPDLSTRNTSFIRTAEVFRQQGIKNYYFHLQLNNPMLKGVDPYSEDLTNEQRTWIAEECRTNFWYFLREVCKLRPDRAFMANRGNLSFIWTYLNHITTYMIMPRQQGKYQRNSNRVRVKAEKGVHWKKIGDIRTGDEVIDRTGQTSLVIGVHPQGSKRLYRVTASDGRYVDAGAEHLWTMGNSERKVNDEIIWDDYTTAEMITETNRKNYLEFPLIDPEEGTSIANKIDPYLMGLLFVGDNQNGKIRFKVFDDKQIRHLIYALPQGMALSLNDQVGILHRPDGEPIKIDRSGGIPSQFLEGSLEDRISCLQAFLDYGHPTPQGWFIPCPKDAVRGGIQYLARGLGGTAKSIPEGILVTLPDHPQIQYFKFNPQPTQELPANRLFIESIDYIGEDECTCIEVDNQEHLYVTEDFLVTHNTVSVQVINFWLTYIMGRGYKSHVITLKSDNRAQLVDAIKKIRSCLPKYLVNPTYKDKDAGTSLTYRAFGEDQVNTLTISVPQVGQDAAGDLGRGLTVGTTNYDEPAYIKWIEDIINGCSPSALTEMEICRNNGLPYGIGYITTPNTTLHTSGAFMFEKLMSATEWREKFFDSYSESHLKERLIKASPKSTTSPAIAMVYNYLQLGKDKEWVKETIDSLNLSLSKAKIDLLLMWVEDGENRLFDDVTREAINNIKREKVWSKEYRSSGLYVDFFHTQQEILEMGRKEHNDFFIIGMDTSSAINKDACTLIIRSLKTGKVVGVGRYPLAFLDDVTAIVVDMLAVFSNSILIPERNYAHHMIDSLLILLPAKDMDPFTRIYNQIYQDPVNHAKELQDIQNTKFAYRNKNFYLKYKQYFGFNTTAKSREILYGLIQEAVGNTGYGINYDKLADELINLRTKGDRIDHDSKQHDDLVIAWLLTYWFIKLGTNKHFYNIPSGIALTDTRNLLQSGKNKQAPELDPSVVQLLDYIRSKVNKLTEELLNTNDNVLALRLEAEIHKLSRYLPAEASKLLTIDDMINAAKIERNKRILQNRKAA